MTTFRDGTGGGYLAKVTSTNRVAVTTESVTAAAVASLERASAFSIGTQGTVSITTTGADSAILYVRNDSALPLIIGAFAVSSTQTGTWTVRRNPTAGTITSSGTALTPINLNFSSGGAASATCFLGANGLTSTGGTVPLNGFTVAGFTVLDTQGAVVLENGAILTLLYNPTVSAVVTANILCAFAGG